MSVWQNHQGGISLPPGTPNIEIHPTPTGACVVVIDGNPTPTTGTYQQCHRWVQNNYRLTSTMMIPVYAAYEAMLPEAPEVPPEQSVNIPDVKHQNKYRKKGK